MKSIEDVAQWHPFLWTLIHVIGLSRSEVGEATGMSKATVSNMVKGLHTKGMASARLRNLLFLKVAELQQLTPPQMTRASEVNERMEAWRQHRLALAQWFLDTHLRPPPPPKPVETELSNILIQLLGQRGARRIDVYAQLKPRHSGQSIRKCAQRLGVKQSQVHGFEFWQPPADIRPLPRQLDLPPQQYVEPRTTLQRRVRHQLELFLAQRDLSLNGETFPSTADAALVEQHLIGKLGFSRSQVYKAARESNLIRWTQGFGADRRTYWRLRPAPKQQMSGSPDTRKPKR